PGHDAPFAGSPLEPALTSRQTCAYPRKQRTHRALHRITRGIMSTPSQRLVKSRLGLDLTPEQVVQYARAAKLIASADGLSDRESSALVARMDALGAPDDVRKEIMDFDVTSATLQDVLKGFPVKHAKALLYSAISVASVDGYTDAERTSVATAAEVLGVD